MFMENNSSNNAQNFFSRQTGKHLLGYSFIGAMSNSIEIGLLFLFVEVFKIYYLGASTIVFILGSMITFVGRKFFVFKDKNLKNIPRQFAKYIFIFLIGVTLNFFIMKVFVEILKIYYALAYLVSILFTGIIGFLWNKKVTFKD